MECSLGFIYRRSSYDWMGPGKQPLCFVKRTKSPFIDFYEFPGGQRLATESSTECLERELYEEIGINPSHCVYVESGKRVSNLKVHISFFKTITHSYQNLKVKLNIYLVSLPHDYKLRSNENKNIIFTNPLYDNKYKYLHSTYRILRLFEIPNELFIADNINHYDIWKKIKYEVYSCRIRQGNMSDTDYYELVKKYIENIIKSSDSNYVKSFLPRIHNHRLLIIDSDNIYKKLPQHYRDFVGGIHYNSHKLDGLDQKNIWSRDDNLQYLSCSCHSRDDLDKACELNFDFALLSPVLISKKENNELGWEGFKALSTTAGLPILALGGIDNTPKSIRLSSLNGGSGVAGISKFWYNKNKSSQ